MAKTRKERRAEADFKLKQPDRTGPSEKTLLQMAQDRQLFQQAEERQRSIAQRSRQVRKTGTVTEEGEDEETADEDEDAAASCPPLVEQLLDTALWSVSLAMLHFTFDMLVQHQYAIEIVWPEVAIRAVQAFFVFSLLFFALHQHASDPTLVRALPATYQRSLRQGIFFATSVAAGCYLVYVTNRHGYLAVMRRAPPLGCLWVWAVIELELPLAVLSLACAGVYTWLGGYGIR